MGVSPFHSLFWLSRWGTAARIGLSGLPGTGHVSVWKDGRLPSFSLFFDCFANHTIMAVHRKDVLKLLESLQQKEKEMENVRSEMSVLQGRLDVCSANLATLEEEVAWVNATFEKWFQNDSLFEELLEMIKKINPEKEEGNMPAEAKNSPGETKKDRFFKVSEQEAPVEAKEHEEKSPKDRKKKSVTLVEPETVQKKDGNKSKNVSVSHSRRSAYDVDSDGEFTSDDPW
ncbi:unnamed protein product [Caenorhabditis auriculariae]|uniref:Uncharacterized protein n=1 Tax=Caenorhabditis auriculariae TaxID=2777116 RepID=A0A8S1H7Q2_9PELO|nr:unnamed protein product [Caenorhabditis auriculariae]